MSPLQSTGGGERERERSGSSSTNSGGISFVSPFQGQSKRLSVSQTSTTPRRRKSQAGGSPARSSSHGRSASTEQVHLPASPRSSHPNSPVPMRSPSVSSASSASFFSGYLNSNAPQTPNGLLSNNVDFTRRRSVDVGVLGVGTHRVHGVTAMSKKVRDAVGPDAGDKETGVIGAGKKGGKDRLSVFPLFSSRLFSPLNFRLPFPIVLPVSAVTSLRYWRILSLFVLNQNPSNLVKIKKVKSEVVHPS